MRILLGLAIVWIMVLKVMLYAQAPNPLEIKKAEPEPQMEVVVPTLEKEREAVDVEAPEEQIPVDTTNLIVYTKPFARLDVYDIHFVYRNVEANVNDGWTLYEKYMDCVAKPIIRNARADKDGMFEVKLKHGTYAIGACDKEHRIGASDIIKIDDKLKIAEVELRSWGQK